MEHNNLLRQPWSVDIADIFTALKTSPDGLQEGEIEERLALYGKNAFKRYEKKSALVIFLKQLTSPLIFILIGAAVITGLLGEWVEVGVISLAVLVNVGLGFYREYHAENTLEKLSSFIKDRSRVIRGGLEEEVDSEMLFPGDIIKLSYGNRIPADARLIHLNNARFNEAILTGESRAIEKTLDILPPSSNVAERTNMVHAGTLVVDGFATAVVVSTADNTEIGKIAGLVSHTDRAQTPIQKGLGRLAWIIFAVVIVIVIGVFILGISRGEPLFDMLVLAVAVSVGAVPESLPIALTVILSIGAERIARKKGVTRTLIAAETLGSTSLIMTDKTGTLTEADMRLVGVYTAEELEKGDTGAKEYGRGDRDLLQLALSNVDVLIENPDEEVKGWTFKGKPFEVNIVRAARDNGIDISILGRKDSSSIVIPFNSTHKFSASRTDKGFTIMGAPDILLALSDIGKEKHDEIESWITRSSTEGKRLIALGTMKSSSKISSVSDVHHISFVGVLAFHDPVRKTVPEAIRKIESLGTKIVMITGDLKGTALSVAEEIGWNISEKEVITGSEIQSLSDEALLEIIPHKKIYVRVTPEDKLRIGLLYRKLGEVVAMTGDGVNDSPALKAMDIGVALGSGSDVAKSVADLVLLDDNFETIAMAIQEGRRILVNIRKTFVYLMSNSLDEVFVVGGSLILGLALPLTALQIIWVNLFTGSLPALAFAYDEDFDHEMSKKHTLKSIFTKEVNVLTFGIGVATSLLLFFTYYALIRYGVDVNLARSIFFVCFASYILVIAFSFRSLHKPLFSYPVFSNKKLNQSIVVAVIILIATMTIPALRNLFELSPLPLVWLWFVAGWLVLNVLLIEGAKLVFRRKYRVVRSLASTHYA
ncbi:MAG: HAD-IC family P-type ATPase [Patescibacteria group bacterium]